mgnify:CR=1 FL=1
MILQIAMIMLLAGGIVSWSILLVEFFIFLFKKGKELVDSLKK